ncbi:CDC50 family protein [Xylariaceae sp. FL0255]|nr:CDC50 family protein [Xylariaceae sp. FL0255]
MDTLSQDVGGASDDKKKSKRPANTAFRQQRLKAWQPIITPKTVIPLFVVIGLVTALVGALLLYASRTVDVVQLDYTNCYSDALESTTDSAPMPDDLVWSSFHGNNTGVSAQWSRQNTSYVYNGRNVTGLTNCTLYFNLPTDMHGPIYMYYHLDNFYQNHRSYVKSFFADQLVGNNVTSSDISGSDCSPLAFNNSRIIYPCGLIANSMFNDTIGAPVKVGSTGSTAERTYNMTEKGIAWTADLQLYGNTPLTEFSSIIPPPTWQIQWPNDEYSTEHPPPNLKEDEHFIVWMRTAALPNFNKLWSKSANSSAALEAGQYSITILDNFRVDKFNGKKKLIITTLSVIGGRNDFLGISWLALSGFCFTLSLVFLVLNYFFPRKLGDHTYLSWNKVAPTNSASKGKGKAPAGPSIGMASGRDL